LISPSCSSLVDLPVDDLGCHGIRRQREHDRIGGLYELTTPLTPGFARKNIIHVEICLDTGVFKQIAQLINLRQSLPEYEMNTFTSTVEDPFASAI